MKLGGLWGRRSAVASVPPDAPGDTKPDVEAPTWLPDPEQVAALDMRRRELLTISNRLGRVDRFSRANAFGAAGTLFAGGALAGTFGLYAFLAQKPNPDLAARLIYFGSLGIAVLVAGLCFLGFVAARTERSDTVGAIKEDQDELLK